MPILAANTGGYSSIPQQEEDVTPIDRNITKRAEKSNRYKIAIVCLIVLAVIAVAFRHQYQERPEVRLYESSMSSPGMRQLLAADIGLGKINFGNVQCDQNIVGYACANAASPSASIEIQSSRKFQKILGFGGAFTEASAVNFYKLPAAAQEKVLQMYFGNDGIGYTLGRIHINSCDFSLESYDFDSVAGDYELKHFDMNVTHDEVSTLPFIRAAMRTSALPIKLVASPWSPPAWMKNPSPDGTQSMTGSAAPNGLKDDPQTQLAWARYISKFITAYAHKGVPIWSVTPQNEPEFAAPWEACAYTAESENAFIQKYLGPVLKDEHPEVLILGFDHNKDHLQAWTEVLMSNAEETYTNGMAFHWYSGGDRVEDGTYGYDAVNASHFLAPDAVLLATEGCSCPGVELGNWLRAERLGHDVMYDLQNHAQGWIDWNLLVDPLGGPNHLKNYCDAALVVNHDSTDVIVQPKYHYMAHFSKFIPPGAERVATAAVGNYNFQEMDPNIQAGVEIGMYACERSVRQTWRIVLPMDVNSEISAVPLATTPGRLQLATAALTQDVTYAGTVHLCVAQSARLPARNALRLADCTDTRAIFLHVTQNDLGQMVDADTTLCLSFIGDVREPGALLELAKCQTEAAQDGVQATTPRAVDSQLFAVDASTGEITAPKVDRQLCLTAGWPFFSAAAFTRASIPGNHELTSAEITSIVVMNEAAVATPLVVYDKERGSHLRLDIRARAIQTITF